MLPIRTASVVLYFLLFSTVWPSHARDLAEGLTKQSTSLALENKNRRYPQWTGIGSLKNALGQTCNAVLLDTRNRQGKAVGPAYVLTSGHCVFFSYGTARLSQAFSADVTFNYFHDTPERHVTYAVKTAHWSSMAGTDLAVLELDTSLAVLIASAVMPLKLASHRQTTDREVINVGAPNGFLKKGLRMSACVESSINSFAEHPGVFPNALRNRCNGLRPGSSGSPMLDRHTNEITSIISKVASAIQKDILNSCQNNSACEAAKFNYSYPTNDLFYCFVDGVFLNDTQDCQLKPIEITLDEPWNLKPYVHLQRDAAGLVTRPTWNLRFSIQEPFYRFKAVNDVSDCTRTLGYQTAVTSDQAYINQPIGPVLGAHVLCILGVQKVEQPLTEALLRNAFTHSVFLTNPAPTPQLKHRYHIDWENQHSSFTRHFYYSMKSVGETTCGDIDDERYTLAMDGIFLDIAEQPVTLCSYARSSVGQPSAIRTDVIEGATVRSQRHIR
ncbi:peptidase [Pseudomonas fluorescens]|uniref:Trypsin-like peptidase domain-containing protein n=1 Tax=Pseudomonas lactucae TaxID=2813360 RepID=A0A9X0YBF1_9PSED|nr:trypsin-like peptidase domain-containing protein [Pseudomonas lactucae]OPA87909.1 peptidase [Pseudomonas fluorescens]MBN2975896.1 trypsin-like peptidase domain-containing protein [Pseudomonas lactucae]MBN2987611.1 trypsin-like peptidase domain-containing protein [Pseudomonas lactucae]OPB07973.1 peptidase [Pseudomonas fluorescens]OPB18747.1 peptidase [Pseudomonas fluorescens]